MISMPGRSVIDGSPICLCD